MSPPPTLNSYVVCWHECEWTSLHAYVGILWRPRRKQRGYYSAVDAITLQSTAAWTWSERCPDARLHRRADKAKSHLGRSPPSRLDRFKSSRVSISVWLMEIMTWELNHFSAFSLTKLLSIYKINEKRFSNMLSYVLLFLLFVCLLFCLFVSLKPVRRRGLFKFR